MEPNPFLFSCKIILKRLKMWASSLVKIAIFQKTIKYEHSGSVVECLALDQGVAGSSLICGSVFCPWERHFILCLVLVQPTIIPT